MKHNFRKAFLLDTYICKKCGMMINKKENATPNFWGGCEIAAKISKLMWEPASWITHSDGSITMKEDKRLTKLLNKYGNLR